MTALVSETRYLLCCEPSPGSTKAHPFATVEFTNEYEGKYFFHRLAFHEFHRDCTKPYGHTAASWSPQSSVVLTPGVGEPGSVATLVSEKELKKKDDVPPHVGWRHRRRHARNSGRHSTLTKLTLPHDANSVVHNKKGTKPKPKKKTQTRTKGMGTPYMPSVVLALSVRSRSDVFLQLSLEYSKSRSTAHPQVGLRRQVGLCPRDNGRVLRSAVSSMSQQLVTSQLRKSGSLGHAEERSELAGGGLGESLREEICNIHVSRNIANSE